MPYFGKMRNSRETNDNTIDVNVQGHPTNLFLTLSVPQRNLAGWKKYRCSDELAGKFIIGRGFAWELLTFSSISIRAGCRNSEETNQFYLAGWEISCVSCWEKGTDNAFPATLKNT